MRAGDAIRVRAALRGAVPALEKLVEAVESSVETLGREVYGAQASRSRRDLDVVRGVASRPPAGDPLEEWVLARAARASLEGLVRRARGGPVASPGAAVCADAASSALGPLRAYEAALRPEGAQD